MRKKIRDCTLLYICIYIDYILKVKYKINTTHYKQLIFSLKNLDNYVLNSLFSSSLFIYSFYLFMLKLNLEEIKNVD